MKSVTMYRDYGAIQKGTNKDIKNQCSTFTVCVLLHEERIVVRHTVNSSNASGDFMIALTGSYHIMQDCSQPLRVSMKTLVGTANT